MIQQKVAKVHSIARSAQSAGMHLKSAEPLKYLVNWTLGEIFGFQHSLEIYIIEAARKNCLVEDGVVQNILDSLAPKMAVLEALGSMSYFEVNRCVRLFGPGNYAATADEQEVLSSYPALLTWYADRLARAAKLDEANAADARQRSQEWDASRPRMMMQDLKSRGIVLSLTRDGKIAVHPGEGVTAAEIEEIKSRKAGFVALLMSSPETQPLTIG